MDNSIRSLASGVLAIHGGPKAISEPFTGYNPIGREEVEAARGVIESGVLSQFLGAWHEDFYGGPKVREFEAIAANYFGSKHAVSVNSWTSGLIAAIGAIGIEPFDEVIVSPWTMCASATAILHWNAIPVFADIHPQTFCLDPKSVAARITPRTKAIVAVDIFGQSADMDALGDLAKRHQLKIVSDTAQAPGAKYQGRFAGTLADVGGFSLNYHKHIHTGEGGILVTDDDTIAERLRLIRNHAEAVVGPKGESSLANMIGYNFRLGEIESAIGIEQIKKLGGFVASRQAAARKLDEGLKGLPGLQLPFVQQGNSHVYYIYPMLLDLERLKARRSWIVEALAAEGVEGLSSGYQNVHLLPMYQKKIAYGKSGFPWSHLPAESQVNYDKGICPVAEEYHDHRFISLAMCKFELSDREVAGVVSAFRKVWSGLAK